MEEVGENVTEGGWSEDDSRLFAGLGEVFIPGREEILRVLLDHIPADREDRFLAVDVGCGRGWLGESVLEEFPHSRVLALDGSAEMRRATERSLSGYDGRFEVRSFRLEDTAWTPNIQEPVRCFLSSLVLHHLDGVGKQNLFRRLWESLEPGGALLYADVIQAGSEPSREHMARTWEEETKKRSLELTGDERAYRVFVEEEWNIFEHPDPIDKPSKVSVQLRWLEEAGFVGVEVPWARSGHAVFCAYKPTA